MHNYIDYGSVYLDTFAISTLVTVGNIPQVDNSGKEN